jgi:hypothetical protein
VRKINVTDLEYLNYNESNTTKAVIDKYTSIYDDLSGNLIKEE